jgi:benzoate/toluate 1,2-dioxygenase reductase subunit
LEAEIKTFPTELIDRRWLSKKTFEIKLSKPSSYIIKAGQRVRLYYQTMERDYTPVSAPADPDITVCIRKVDTGKFTPALSTADIGTRFDISRPEGYFTFKPSPLPPVFVATGTGIAPFCSMVRSGVTGFTLLHGVDSPQDLYYQSELESAADLYIPCISRECRSSDEYFRGRVTNYLQEHLPAAQYDFYLCGRREMIREVTWLVDERFPGSFIYSEQFY